jgi:Class III cytochrome C family
MPGRMTGWNAALAAVVAGAVVVAACGTGKGSGGSSATAAAAESSAAQSEPHVVPVAMPRPAALVEPSGPYAFHHEKHRELKCVRCHTAVPGHSVHVDVACTSCHAPVPVTGPVPTPEQCASCHHATTQPLTCGTCHAPASHGALTLTVQWTLSVWRGPRQREIQFDHAWHTSRQCTDCHNQRPEMVPTQACATCHAHHEGQADCRICHRSPPPGVHTAAAHEGCTGSGCHQNPPVTVATLSRDECLLCHADRVNHQPGKPCAQCHMLKTSHDSSGGGGAGS